MFGKDPNKNINPDKIVAIAIQAGLLQERHKRCITIRYYTIVIWNWNSRKYIYQDWLKIIIIPTKRSQILSTAEDNQSAVTIKVYQEEGKWLITTKC